MSETWKDVTADEYSRVVGGLMKEVDTLKCTQRHMDFCRNMMQVADDETLAVAIGHMKIDLYQLKIKQSSINSQLEALKGLLVRLEWSAWRFADGTVGCPSCGHSPSMKHSETCELAKAIHS